MKNVRLIFVLLLMVNCTADLTDNEETSVSPDLQPQEQNCIDDLPKIRLTNNGTHNFDFIIYDLDFNILYTQNVSTVADSGWIELSSNDVLVVVTNNVVYGQKVEFNLVPCDNKDLEINTSNALIVTGG